MKNIAKKYSKRQPKIKAEMSGKGLTVHAGLLPVLNFMGKLMFRERVHEAVHKDRGANARYQFVDAVQMVVIGLIAGATSMVEVMKVCTDEVLKKMSGWKEVPVDTTIGRIMKLASQGDIAELTGVIHRFRGKIWKRAVRSGHKLRSALCEVWIDVDSTVDGVYGKQEGAEVGYNPHKKGQKAYHPLMAFIAETKEVLHSWFRCGSAYTSNGVVEFMKECMAYMNKGVRVVFRGDSGFFTGELLEYLESILAGYLIKVKLKNLEGLLEGQKWNEVKGEPGWEQAEFWYRCAGWDRARRFVAVRQLVKREKKLVEVSVYEYFCYVTTERLSPMEAHRCYGKRATCETLIEESKGQMNAGHIRTGEFLANAALFQCAVLAYNLLKWMGLLSGGVIQKWEVKTMRLWLIRVAGKLVERSRQMTLKLPEKFLHQEEWEKWERMSLDVVFQ
ncbi:transposase [Candidatus Kuenenia stuttgartiensis]|uniref:Transposase n=1 Tax=Kuenenia stuttgartiensis TaxID=174633 RepID=Q1Q125_KUEST|nr:IS1380-like element ISCku8 family transposase [Candidatus Kuenenia stuttgartiensis]QII09630.1 transposase [Candidatus Kuenenia stuttgartiensis]QII10861.1 transposase [Candidatus Kuenenia stuttgartiensis]CAJ73701.1 Similar to transposase tnpA [Candidatus Kuenenia stuttgartiensis]CAJ73833.1 Similar to transposase tnpA [Candidatus Kuenenia stuttgartiensis]